MLEGKKKSFKLLFFFVVNLAYLRIRVLLDLDPQLQKIIYIFLISWPKEKCFGKVKSKKRKKERKKKKVRLQISFLIFHASQAND